ncbi:Hypothetical protein NGAL_HAMBI1146_58550 [Neorhizobium galegae bv. officinalis]|nr:Hypothetical protein NGAL_HAMBI1146_58550 [Neorhizobium galegae bv. officinalis]
MTIEQALGWAFNLELCKIGVSVPLGPGYSQAWSMMSEVAALGTIVDRSPNAYGVIPDFVMTSEPHPDALTIGGAVRCLADRGRFEIPAGWNPLGDWTDEHGLVAHDLAAVVDSLRAKSDLLGGKHVVNLVVSHAILGRGPGWDAVQPKASMVMRRGKPAWFVLKKAKDSLGRVYSHEVDGFDQGKQRPMRGAYRKYQLDGSVRFAALSRLDWQLWQDALSALHDELLGQLHYVDLLQFWPDRQPWMRRKNSQQFDQPVEKA